MEDILKLDVILKSSILLPIIWANSRVRYFFYNIYLWPYKYDVTRLTLQVCQVAELFFSGALSTCTFVVERKLCFSKTECLRHLADALLICDKGLQVENVWEAITSLRLFKCHNESIWNWKIERKRETLFLKRLEIRWKKLYFEWKSENIKLI